ncbi:FAD dependent oxidoreductase [Gymnopilus junonius]|uniref:FAD dependent oxidoreductase n=1 Tax=Gymnopilus junonius TaxID=109634 RepID=A0A9P5P1W2_GYMJU|nr:FAD dependent oxidoreductase [Gymnopilus junonius]
MILPKNEKVVIIGAGCFGVSTACHLLQRGYTDVTVLDRSTTLPAPDAASNDLNRIVRSSYDDRFYSELAREAISSWRDREKWGDSYHESGVAVLGTSSDLKAGTYTDESYKNDIALGASVKLLENSDVIRSIFPPQVRTGAFEQSAGYLNHEGGWANAGQGLAVLIDRVKALNGKIFSGMNVTKVVQEDGKTTGVQCNDGTVFNASLVIVASGSWTPSAFPELDLGRVCLATGQCVAMIQLSESEADIYRDCPVVLDFSSGFYVFPPNEGNIVKMAIHAAGYTYFDEPNGTISTPRTITSDPARGLLIPKTALRDLRVQLRKVYPDLAEKPLLGTRLCWYNDSPDGNWVIGRHPKDDSLVIATAGSGHAYKFLPVIGRLVADLIEDKLDTQLVEKFSVDRQVLKVDLSRTGAPVKLDLNDLYQPEDLL